MELLMNQDEHTLKMTVEEQLAELRRASEEEGWNIPDETFGRLAETAPAWPDGYNALRSFRIRFGEGDGGVQQTFEAHVWRCRTMFGDRHWADPTLGTDECPVRLRAGNATHKACVEWIVIRDFRHGEGGDAESVLSDRSLADEGLVIKWLFARFVTGACFNPWACLGYEVNAVAKTGEEWCHTVHVGAVWWYYDSIVNPAHLKTLDIICGFPKYE